MHQKSAKMVKRVGHGYGGGGGGGEELREWREDRGGSCILLFSFY